MNFADKKTVEKLRKEFPVGCRIVLDEMDDRQAPTIGTQGTCNGVDDAGNILVSWDTGSHLNVAYGADSCHRVATDAEVKVSLDRQANPVAVPACGDDKLPAAPGNGKAGAAQIKGLAHLQPCLLYTAT